MSNPHHGPIAAALITLTLALLSACATSPWTVESYAAPEGKVAARDPFFIKGGEIATPTTVESGLEQQLHADVREAIRTELAKKGYSEAKDLASAQLVVSYQIAGSNRSVMMDAPRVGAPSPNTVLSPSAVQPPPLSAVPRERQVRTNTVIVFIDDPASDRLLWRGSITAETRVGSPQDGLRVIADMVRHIVQQLPPHAGQRPK